MAAHLQVIRELEEMNVNVGKPGPLHTGGYYTGVREMDSADRERLIKEGRNFGLWRKGQEEVMIVPVYSQKHGTIVAVRFWEPRRGARPWMDFFARLLEESIPLSEYAQAATPQGKAQRASA